MPDMELNYLLIIINSYLLGCIPTAYLYVKLFAKKNVLSEGSGNAGALNSYEITGKRWIGIAVMLTDAGKGMLAVYAARLIGGDEVIYAALGAIWVVIGHNYNAFMRLKGGRGLAAAMGAFILINPLAIILWGILWAVGYYIFKKNVHVGNSVALVLMPFLFSSHPSLMLEATSTIPVDSLLELKVFVFVICFLILLRHIKPLMELFGKKED